MAVKIQQKCPRVVEVLAWVISRVILADLAGDQFVLALFSPLQLVAVAHTHKAHPKSHKAHTNTHEAHKAHTKHTQSTHKATKHKAHARALAHTHTKHKAHIRTQSTKHKAQAHAQIRIERVWS
jgi:hypothetical protein